jgi:hypothetical protein
VRLNREKKENNIAGDLHCDRGLRLNEGVIDPGAQTESPGDASTLSRPDFAYYLLSINEMAVYSRGVDGSCPTQEPSRCSPRSLLLAPQKAAMRFHFIASWVIAINRHLRACQAS